MKEGTEEEREPSGIFLPCVPPNCSTASPTALLSECSNTGTYRDTLFTHHRAERILGQI